MLLIPFHNEDTSAPIISLDTGGYVSGTVSTDNITIQINAYDEESGIDPLSYQKSDDNGNTWTSGNSFIYVDEIDSTIDFKFKVKNNAGIENIFSTTYHIIIDKTPLNISVSTTPSDTSNTIYGPVTVQAASDHPELEDVSSWRQKILHWGHANHNAELDGHGVNASEDPECLYFINSHQNIKQSKGTCYIDNNDVLWGGGLNPEGFLGTGNTDPQYNGYIQIATDVKYAFTIDGVHSLIYIKNNGEVYGAGQNSSGQLGTGDTTDKHTFVRLYANGNSSTPLVGKFGAGTGGFMHTGFIVDINDDLYIVSGNKWVYSTDNVKQIVTAYTSHMILKYDGTVWSMGANSQYQLGLGDDSGRSSWTQVSIPYTIPGSGGRGVALEIAKGDFFTYILNDYNQLYGVGLDQRGGFGTGTTSTQYNNWTLIQDNVEHVFTTLRSTFIQKTDKTMYGIGLDDHGTFGDGVKRSEDSSQPNWIQALINNIEMVDGPKGGFSHGFWFVDSNGNRWVSGGNTHNRYGIVPGVWAIGNKMTYHSDTHPSTIDFTAEFKVNKTDGLLSTYSGSLHMDIVRRSINSLNLNGYTGAWTNQNVTITPVYDTNIGYVTGSVYYNINTANWINGTDILFSGEGNLLAHIQYKTTNGYDLINYSQIFTENIAIDKTAPTIDSVDITSSDNNIYGDNAATITISYTNADDALSGINHVTINLIGPENNNVSFTGA